MVGEMYAFLWEMDDFGMQWRALKFRARTVGSYFAPSYGKRNVWFSFRKRWLWRANGGGQIPGVHFCTLSRSPPIWYAKCIVFYQKLVTLGCEWGVVRVRTFDFISPSSMVSAMNSFPLGIDDFGVRVGGARIPGAHFCILLSTPVW